MLSRRSTTCRIRAEFGHHQGRRGWLRSPFGEEMGPHGMHPVWQQQHRLGVQHVVEAGFPRAGHAGDHVVLETEREIGEVSRRDLRQPSGASPWRALTRCQTAPCPHPVGPAAAAAPARTAGRSTRCEAGPEARATEQVAVGDVKHPVRHARIGRDRRIARASRRATVSSVSAVYARAWPGKSEGQAELRQIAAQAPMVETRLRAPGREIRGSVRPARGPAPALARPALHQQVLLVVVEVGRHVPRVVLPGGRRERAQVQAVPLRAFQQVHVPEAQRAGARVQQVTQHRHVRGDVLDAAFREGRPRRVDDVRHRPCFVDRSSAGCRVGEVGRRIARVLVRCVGELAAEPDNLPSRRFRRSSTSRASRGCSRGSRDDCDVVAVSLAHDASGDTWGISPTGFEFQSTSSSFGVRQGSRE